MDLDDIKRGLRAEIKKRENEQYFTFQCNVRQMCKDVLAKLEEQESVIAEKDEKIAELEMKVARAQLVLRLNKPEALYSNLETMSRLTHERYVVERRERHQKYKRCLAMAMLCKSRACFYDTMRENGLYWAWKSDRAYKWHKRWLELAEKFKEAK